MLSGPLGIFSPDRLSDQVGRGTFALRRPALVLVVTEVGRWRSGLCTLESVFYMKVSLGWTHVGGAKEEKSYALGTS